MTPYEAYELGRKEGPSDKTRAIACKDYKWAFKYARDIDKCHRGDTRAAVCKDPWWAYGYAIDVDKCPRDDTRAAVCKDPWPAYLYARHVDKFISYAAHMIYPNLCLKSSLPILYDPMFLSAPEYFEEGRCLV